jgi:hypothetical protein
MIVEQEIRTLHTTMVGLIDQIEAMITIINTLNDGAATLAGVVQRQEARIKALEARSGKTCGCIVQVQIGDDERCSWCGLLLPDDGPTMNGTP